MHLGYVFLKKLFPISLDNHAVDHYPFMSVFSVKVHRNVFVMYLVESRLQIVYKEKVFNLIEVYFLPVYFVLNNDQVLDVIILIHVF